MNISNKLIEFRSVKNIQFFLYIITKTDPLKKKKNGQVLKLFLNLYLKALLFFFFLVYLVS